MRGRGYAAAVRTALLLLSACDFVGMIESGGPLRSSDAGDAPSGDDLAPTAADDDGDPTDDGTDLPPPATPSASDPADAGPPTDAGIDSLADAAPPSPGPDAAPPPPAPDAAPTANELDELVALFNQERASLGLVAVTRDPILDCAAATLAIDIGTAKLCSHIGTDGSTPTDRVVGCGGTSWSGEIVVCGAGSAAAAMAAWKGSPGHYAILTTPEQRDVGVAEHGGYWVAIFDY